MLISILFVLVFLLTIAAIVLYPKVDGKINGYKVAIMSFMAVFCYEAFMVFLLSKMRIAVNLISTLMLLLIAAFMLWIEIIKKRSVQKLYFPKIDLVYLILLSVFILAISKHLFSTDLLLRYANIDAAAHFISAMDIVSSKNVSGLYFTAYIDAMFIELLLPFTGMERAYKGFICADIFLHILEIMMFYVLSTTISNKKNMKMVSMLLSIMYFWGFPAYSYMTGGFVYWSTGVMIFMFIIYGFLVFERYPEFTRGGVVLLLLGCYANLICNKLFVVANTFCVLTVVTYLGIQYRRKQSLKKILLVGGFGFGFLVVGVYIFFQFQWGGKLANLLYTLGFEGGTYRALYGDIIYFIPILVHLFYYAFKDRKYSKILCIVNIGTIFVAFIMFLFWFNFKMSNYYYYKIYYNLWLMGFLSVVMLIDVLIEERHVISMVAYGTMIVAIMAISVFDIESYFWNKNPYYNGSYAMNQFMPLYNYNVQSIKTDYAQYEISPNRLEAFSYVLDNYVGEQIPILLNNSDVGLWYQGITMQQRTCVYTKDLPQTIIELNTTDVDKIMVLKTDSYYEKYKMYFDACDIVYENEEALLLARPDGGWGNVPELFPDYSAEKLHLYEYEATYFGQIALPLMAGEESYIDFIAFQNITNINSVNYYTWNRSPLENIEHLNGNNVEYIMLLKDDPYYERNQRYYNQQEIVYENEAGMIIRHRGDEWSTQYR